MDLDYAEEERALVNKLALSVNSGFESLYQALSRKLTFGDNIQASIKEIDVSIDATGKPIISTTFKLDDPLMKVSGVIILSCTNLNNASSYPSTAPFIFWTQTSTGIQVDNIAGLNIGPTYRLRVLAI
jgi:hypothetical protein